MKLQRFLLSISFLAALPVVQAHDDVYGLNDLVGKSRNSGDNQMRQRGFTLQRTEFNGSSGHSYYREARTGRCIAVHVNNDRYSAITYTEDADCGGVFGGSYDSRYSYSQNNLQDIVGMQWRDGEYEMRQRGYSIARNDGNGRVTLWQRGNECVATEMSNGRYSYVNRVGVSECNGGYNRGRYDDGNYNRGGGYGYGYNNGGFGLGRVTDRRQASIRGGGGEGKCTLEVNVDDTAEVEITGTNAVVRTLSGAPASIRRFECNQPMPYNAYGFRFEGVDGRGSQNLVRDPSSGGPVVIRIVDSKGGSESYTFDVFWNGGR